MVTLQDISVRLMKPAKDLADWKFPLSQILEEYYALLEEPCSINFGEAALVLQNSANVYVRRVECLLNETEILKQMFFGYEEHDMKKPTCKERKSIKKGYVEFENFTIINLEEEIGKNIEKKNQCRMRKRIKLLSRRFTQLENSTTQLCVPIQVYDVYGEVMGKKYDFRCNQSINANCMLVDELTLDDFAYALGSRIHKGRNPSSISSEPKTPGTRTSGYHSSTSLHKCITPINGESEEEHNSMLQVPNSLLTNDNYLDSIANGEDSSYSDLCTSTQTNSGKDSSPEEQTHGSGGHETNVTDFTKENKVSEVLLGNEKYVSKSESDNSKPSICEGNCSSVENSVEAKHIKNTEKHVAMEKRRTQMTKTSTCLVNDQTEPEWKLMPLTRGSKNVIIDKSCPLKLPSYFSLLKTKSGSRKRKLTAKMRKSECLTRFVLRETEACRADKKTNTLMKSKFRSLRKQELEDFMKSLDECLNGVQEDTDNSHYEAVTSVAMDLLGFRSSETKNNPTKDNVQEDLSRSPSPLSIEDVEPESTSFIAFDGVEPPSVYNNCLQVDLSYALPNYHTLIEDRMKEIIQESNVATELEHTVAEWHASLQSKLSDADLRPAFQIHDYASRIIGSLQTLGQRRVDFDKIVRGKPACEVARYFLASLQLANTYNLEIKTETSGSGIEISLLDRGKD